MKVSEAIDTVQEKVKDLLERYEETRDDDKILWLGYLNVHFGLKKNMSEESYQFFKNVILNKDTPTSDTITRARRKIQEQCPDLVGEKRKQRKAEAEDVRKWAVQNRG